MRKALEGDQRLLPLDIEERSHVGLCETGPETAIGRSRYQQLSAVPRSLRTTRSAAERRILTSSIRLRRGVGPVDFRRRIWQGYRREDEGSRHLRTLWRQSRPNADGRTRARWVATSTERREERSTRVQWRPLTPGRGRVARQFTHRSEGTVRRSDGTDTAYQRPCGVTHRSEGSSWEERSGRLARIQRLRQPVFQDDGSSTCNWSAMSPRTASNRRPSRFPHAAAAVTRPSHRRTGFRGSRLPPRAVSGDTVAPGATIPQLYKRLN